MPINYAMNMPQPFERANTFYGGSRHLDTDPFGISKDSSFKQSQKLSPTASVFSPLHSTLTGTATTVDTQTASDVLSEDLNSQSHGRPSGKSSPIDYIHDELSTDSGLSRCMAVCVRVGGRMPMTKVDLEFFLSV